MVWYIKLTSGEELFSSNIEYDEDSIILTNPLLLEYVTFPEEPDTKIIRMNEITPFVRKDRYRVQMSSIILVEETVPEVDEFYEASVLYVMKKDRKWLIDSLKATSEMVRQKTKSNDATKDDPPETQTSSNKKPLH